MHSTRRTFLKNVGLGMAGLGLWGGLSKAFGSTPSQPNILFIFSDDHAPHAISAYGSKINVTPHIDRLANEGATFDRCYCSNAVCGPSRAAILTGKHSHINGFMENGDTFNASQDTFPKQLQLAGYETAVIGKWHLGTNPTGFDHWDIIPLQGNYYNPDLRDHVSGSLSRRNGYVTDVITDLSLDWLQSGRDPNKPFLLMCQHKAPHQAWLPGPDHLTMYDDVEIPEPDSLFDDYAGRNDVLKDSPLTVGERTTLDDLQFNQCSEYSRMTADQRTAWAAAFDPKNAQFWQANPQGKDLVRWRYQRYMQNYLSCVASVDDNIGRMLDYLDQSGLADNTIVIYNSDQGFFLGEHGWIDKRWMFEESSRMPFIVRWPGVTTPGVRVKALAQNIDFAPTFLDAAGATIPSEIQGVSLRPLMEGQTPGNWRDSLYYHYYLDHSVVEHEGVYTDRYKLIHYIATDEWDLFDLQKDPKEMKSVVADPAYATQLAIMQAELQTLRQQYNVPA